MFTSGNLPFAICVKPLQSMEGIERFNELNLPNLTFPTDGYVITSLSAPAKPYRMQRNAFFKWKPVSTDGKYNENTIDVTITPVLHTNNRTLTDLPTTLSNNLKINTENINRFRTAEGNAEMKVLHNRELVLFSYIYFQSPIQQNQSYECKWNYQIRQWEVCRSRNKKPNTLDTALHCLVNIVEDITVADLCKTK
jgi:hypothetical protein